MRLYNRALSSTEVQQLYTSPAGNISSTSYYSESYAYDTIGNMTSKNGVSYVYGARPHAALFVGEYALAYDANGNMTERNNATGSQQLTWNMSNQLARVEGVGGSYTDTTAFVYDGDGKRIAKTVGATTTVYPSKYYEKTGSEGTSNYYLGDRLVGEEGLHPRLHPPGPPGKHFSIIRRHHRGRNIEQQLLSVWWSKGEFRDTSDR